MTLEGIEVRGKRIWVRADLNVPLMGEGPERTIRDRTRIEAVVPTLRRLIDEGARVTVASHLGRPKGTVRPELSLRPVARALAETLGQDVRFVDAVVGPRVRAAREALEPGQVALLENLRFDPGEEKDDPEFARALAEGTDLVVIDAFGAVHRAHASVHAIARIVEAVAGLLVEREVRALSRVRDHPEAPFVLVVGGAKIADKLGVLKRLGPRAARVLVGGGMANTLLRARGNRLGRSLVETDRLAEARQIIGELGDRLALPVDLRTGSALDDPNPQVTGTDAVRDEDMALDIGPRTEQVFRDALEGAKTVFWNGPMGVYEQPAYRKGTLAVADAVSEVDGFSVVGGGDSVAALAQSGRTGRVSHVSTGGGASLEFLEGRDLPGLQVLTRNGAGV